MEIKKEKPLKDTLEEIASKLDSLTAAKAVQEWKLPWTQRWSWNLFGKMLKRKGYVLFMHIGTNKAVTYIKAPVDEGVAMINGIPHVIHTDDILIWKNKIPMVIQPAWSEKPLSASQHFGETLKEGKGSMGWEFIMNYILKSQIKEKKSFSMGAVILGILVLIGVGYYVIKSGALS